MPDGYTFADRKRWQPELARPLSRQEQDLLADLIRWQAEHRTIHGSRLGNGYRLAMRDMVRALSIDSDFTVKADVTPFGRMVAHAHDAVNLCHAHPLETPLPPLFKMDCPECNGTGAEDPDCWLCKGDRTIRVHRAYRNGYKKADLENVEDDGLCDCPACDGHTCGTCEGDGTVLTDYLWREAQRVLLSALQGCKEPFPRIEWSERGGSVDVDALLSPAGHAWLYDLGLSYGRIGNMFSEWVNLSREGEQAAAELLVPSETADLVRMWQAGSPWKPRKPSGDYYRPYERDLFEEAAAFHRCRFRGWIDWDHRSGDCVWTEDGRTALAGWDGAEIELEQDRIDQPCSLLRNMESVSRERREADRWAAELVRRAELVEAAQAMVEATEHAGDQHCIRRWSSILRDRTFNHGWALKQFDNHRRYLAWALQCRQKESERHQHIYGESYA